MEALSEAERILLRDSLRGFLAEHWPSADAPERSRDPAAVRAIWRGLGGQGLPALGSEPAEGGAAEILVVLQELGRAACPAPMLGAVAANTLLWPARKQAAAIEKMLVALHAGEASVAVALGKLDLDPNAGEATLSNGRVSGTLRFVEAASFATHLLIHVAEGLALVESGASGVEVVTTRALGVEGLAEVRLDAAPAILVEIPAGKIEDYNRLERMCLVARSLGAADRGLEMAVEYAKVRQQFGRLIGSFQALQHKLADCLITASAVRVTIQNAARNYDLAREAGSTDWVVFASAAYAYAGGALRQFALQIQHAFGAVGYAEAHEVPRHFRRIHLDLVRHGGVLNAREELAAYLLDGPSHRLPEYDLGPAGNAFRQTVRAWLTEHWTEERKAEQEKLPFHKRDYNAEFARAMGETGWIAMSWPEEYGGQARTPLEQLAYIEETERAEAPRTGAPIQSAALMVYGTRKQKDTYLPAIKRGEMMFGMGYSEPDSGSDLASMRTKCERVGDEWVVNGQKIWTTTWWASHVWLAVRTDPHSKPKHAGLSMLVVPMDTPGITVRTMETMYSGTFANVFYDNVRVPLDALVGEVNGGWEVVTGALATERGYVGGNIVAKMNHMFGLLCEYIRGATVNGRALRRDPVVRDRIGDLAAAIEVGRQMAIHCVNMIEGGKMPHLEAALCKVYAGELMERMYETAIDLLGMQATLSEDAPGAILKGRIEQRLRHSLMWVISLGTNEIQRTLIAQQGLDLPKK